MRRNNWILWLDENITLGCPRERLLDEMVAKGFDRDFAESLYDLVLGNPSGATATSPQDLLNLRHLVRTSSPAWMTVPRVERPSSSDFLTRFYSTNQPVVLTGVVTDWPAYARWDAEYLRAALGDEVVEVMAGREGDPDYEVNCNYHRLDIKFGELIDLAESGVDSNDVYLTANNRFLERPAALALFKDFAPLPEYLDAQAAHGRTFFWYGSAGVVTPMHYDTSNILLAQVRGTKRVLLIPPELTPRLYNRVGVFSDVNPESPDYGAHPLFEGVEPIEVILEQGETLFLPVGWWHYVRSLSSSISLSFTNFVFPNSYRWKHLS